MNVVVTGANGFVGRALVTRLTNLSVAVVPCVRRACWIPGEIVIGEVDGGTHWSAAVEGCDAVVHLAARVHVMRDKALNPLQEFRRTNVSGTLNLARQAASAGVRRFIFLSSVKVNGESSPHGAPFTENDTPAPQDAYGLSKLEAEIGLRAIATETGMEVVVIRSPLVYGPGVKANFLVMMRLLARGIPLPLAVVTNNLRSLTSLANLVNFIEVCLTHPAAANQTFFVSDGEDLSTAELLSRLGKAIGRPARLFYVPLGILKLGAIVLNRSGVFERLCGTLQIDISKNLKLLGWKPQITVDEGFRITANGFPRS